LVSNDIHPKRVRDLAKNLERWGATNIAITNETPPRLVQHFGAYFDRVLVDAPCSGEGMFRKDPSARKEWTSKLVESCALRQDGIMADAARLVRPGGVLAYATCTFAPQEDEGTIARFLIENPAFELIQPPFFLGFESGRPDWVPDANPGLALERTIRLWPHLAPGEGHFIALMQRTSSSGDHSSCLATAKPLKLPRDSQDYFDQFCSATLGWELPRDRLSRHGSYLYLLPEGMPSLQGLRVIHWGWWLGTLKVKRFEPCHALAMGLRVEDVQQVISFSAHEPETLAYLHGDVLSIPGPDGWVLVAVDGFSLGWGKRVQGKLKSHSPKWLRWI
jgi:NOL1/NOP2/fmu family ribosome biogenesis protein